MSAIYGAFDIFVSTSRYEGLPLVVIEALVSNLPCVLNDAIGLRDFAKYEFNMIAYPPSSSAEDFAASVLNLQGGIAAGKTPNHREIALRRFSPSQNAQEVIRVYNNHIAFDLVSK